MRGCFHRLDIDSRHTSFGILHDDIEHPLAVRYALLRHAAKIDRSEHVPILGIDHGRILRRMTEDVDSFIESVEDNPVRRGGAHIDGLDQLHRFRVEHGDRPAAGESMTGFRIDGSPVAADTLDFTGRFERVEIEYRQACGDTRRRPAAPRNVQAASGNISIDVVPVAFTTGLESLENFVWSRGRMLLSQPNGHSKTDRDRQNCGKSMHTWPPQRGSVSRHP